MGNDISIRSRKGKILLIALIVFFFAFEGILWMRRADRLGVFVKRSVITSIIVSFAGLHLFVDIKKMYDWMFRYRWLIAAGVFLFLVINKYHFSSVTMWNDYIQPGMGSQYVEPIFGRPRPIRSDEWVLVPETLSGILTNFSKYNDLVTGTAVPNFTVSGLYMDYVLLARPASWGYYLFGAEYGISFSWAVKWIFGFMFSFELFLILTKGKRLISLFGASMFFFSMFNMWWSIPYQPISACGIIVLFYHFLTCKSSLFRFFLGTVLAITGASFCTRLYPAWQVPLGWMIVAAMIWIVLETRKTMNFKPIDWVIFVIDVAFMVSIIYRFLIVNRMYTTAIMNTVYPGKRVSYGGYALSKLLGYITTLTTPFDSHANPSEMGVIFGVFPLAYILTLIVQVKQRFRNKKLWLFSVPALILTVYCATELPHILAKVLMLTYSKPERAVDILGINLLILMVISLAELDDEGGIPIWLSILICIICIVPAAHQTLLTNSGWRIVYIVLICFVAVLEPFIVYCRKHTPRFMIIGTVLFAFLGLLVHPLVYGLDVIYSKPVAKEIQRIAEEDPDALWCGLNSFVIPNFIVAHGGKTLNALNQIPNMSFWKKLDPEGEYESVYNRYAHFIIILGEKTEIILNQEDLLTLKVTEDDFKKIGVKYILTTEEIPLETYKIFKQTYHEGNTFIYEYIGA